MHPWNRQRTSRFWRKAHCLRSAKKSTSEKCHLNAQLTMTVMWIKIATWRWLRTSISCTHPPTPTSIITSEKSRLAARWRKLQQRSAFSHGSEASSSGRDCPDWMSFERASDAFRPGSEVRSAVNALPRKATSLRHPTPRAESSIATCSSSVAQILKTRTKRFWSWKIRWSCSVEKLRLWSYREISMRKLWGISSRRWSSFYSSKARISIIISTKSSSPAFLRVKEMSGRIHSNKKYKCSSNNDRNRRTGDTCLTLLTNTLNDIPISLL